MKKGALWAVIAAGTLILTACNAEGGTPLPPTTHYKAPKTTVATKKKAPSAPSAPAKKSNALAKYLAVNAAQKQATLTLIGGMPGDSNIFNFNGTQNGQMVVTIPQGWKVTVNFTNKGAVNHSAAITPNLPQSTTIAFPGASTPNPVAGLTTGQSASFTFTASKTGTYRIVCLVPAHEGLGMWATLDIVAGGTASIQ